MRLILLRRLSILLVLIIQLVACNYKTENRNNMIEKNLSSEIAILSITHESKIYQIGEPILIHLALQNTASQILQIGVSTPTQDFEFDLSFDGQQVLRTPYGQQLLDYGSTFKMSLMDLQPDRIYEWTVDLQELFVIDKPGKYILNVQRQIRNPKTEKWELIKALPKILSVKPKGDYTKSMEESTDLELSVMIGIEKSISNYLNRTKNLLCRNPPSKNS